MLENATCDFDLGVGCAVDHVVKRGGHVSEEILQIRPVRRFTCKHEAAIAFHPRYSRHCGVRIGGVEVVRVSMLQWSSLDAAVEVIGPTVIATGELGRVTAFGRDHKRAAVSTLIVDDVNAIVAIAHQHHRLAPDPGGEIVAGIFHLALVPDIDPGGGENPFELKLEYCGVLVDAPMHAARLHEAQQLLSGELHHSHLDIEHCARKKSPM